MAKLSIDKETLLKLIKSGKSHSEIANIFGCTRSNISYYAKRLNIELNNSNKQIDINLLKKEVNNGMSFSEFSRKYKHTLSAVSKVAKKNNISPPSNPIIKKNTKTPVPVFEQFSSDQKDMIISMWNEGKTQEQIGAYFGSPRRTIMKLCKHLNLSRSNKKASSLSNRSKLDKPEIVSKIRKLRNNHSIAEIANIVDSSSSAVQRICDKYDIKLNRELFAAIQSDRMKKSWTEEKRQKISGSKYYELNDKNWLYNKYIIKNMSMSEISKILNAPLVSVSYFLRKHGIQIKSKDEVYSKLRRLSSKNIKINTKWGMLSLHSKAEEKFVKSLSDDVKSVEYEKYKLSACGLQYVPDFKVDGEFIEIKPPEYSKHPGVDRQKFIKQLLIAQHNDVNVKLWYNGKYFCSEPITDIDKYFCLNWKLIFKNQHECFKFIIAHGFKPLEYSRDNLLIALNNLFKADGDDRLSATFQNSHVLNFIKHFNPHYWSSRRARYNAISKAFEPGNTSILMNSINDLWNHKRNVNIYGLINTISKNYKDFAVVSIFKPWVAKFVYDELLPNGGTVVDPCMGWGGRFLGAIDNNIKYIGYDLNPNSIVAHNTMRNFIGSRIKINPTFDSKDAAKIAWPSCDLLFTSPPYNNSEIYHGLENQDCNLIEICKNLLNFKGIVALNIPIKYREIIIDLAAKHKHNFIKEYKMKTANFMGKRETTYEPILVFDKIR